MTSRNINITLTALEYGTLLEALALMQQTVNEGTGKLSPEVSRIQRKLNTEVGYE